MRGRLFNILLWVVQALLAFVFVNASWAKVTGMPEMLELFDLVGVGQWFRYLTAVLEFAGAVLILVPRMSRYGAAVLATVMLGAITAHLFILHVPITTPGVLFVMACFVAWGRGRPLPTSRG